MVQSSPILVMTGGWFIFVQTTSSLLIHTYPTYDCDRTRSSLQHFARRCPCYLLWGHHRSWAGGNQMGKRASQLAEMVAGTFGYSKSSCLIIKDINQRSTVAWLDVLWSFDEEESFGNQNTEWNWACSQHSDFKQFKRGWYVLWRMCPSISCSPGFHDVPTISPL